MMQASAWMNWELICAVVLATCTPDEAPTFKPLREKTQPIAVPPQQLDQITPPTAENKHVTRKRILLKCRLYHATQPCKTTPQIRESGGDPDARSCRQPDHPSKHSSTVRSASASTLPVMRTCPFGSLISIAPKLHRDETQRTCPDLFDGISETATGRRLLDRPLPSLPSRYFLRQ